MSEKVKPGRDGVDRRRFLADAAKTACGVGVAGLVLGLFARLRLGRRFLVAEILERAALDDVLQDADGSTEVTAS